MTLRKITVREALKEAMAEEMRATPEVFVMLNFLGSLHLVFHES